RVQRHQHGARHAVWRAGQAGAARLGPAAGHRGTPPPVPDHRGRAGDPGRAAQDDAADRARGPAAHRHGRGGVMQPALAARLSRVLVTCHPRRWRERYGAEMLDVLDQHQMTARTVASLGASAVSAHLDPAYRTEHLSLSRLRRAALISAAIAAPLVLILGP